MPAELPVVVLARSGVVVGRSIGLDVHRDFCQVAIADGGRALGGPDRHDARAACAVRAGHARVKTDKVDAKVLADLLAAGPIPAVWIGDERARVLRRQVSRRRGLVKRRTRVNNEILAVLHRNLKGRNPASDPFGKKGRAWIAAQQLPIDERLTVDGCLRHLDFLGDELAQIDAIIAEHALGDGDVRRLMTIPGIDVVTALVPLPRSLMLTRNQLFAPGRRHRRLAA